MIRVKEGYQDMQFSKRLDLFGDEIFAALNERKVELEAQGRTIYNLSVGTPDFAPAEHIRKAMMDAAADPQGRSRRTFTKGAAMGSCIEILQCRCRFSLRPF